jgi:hypothetical protein
MRAREACLVQLLLGGAQRGNKTAQRRLVAVGCGTSNAAARRGSARPAALQRTMQ